MTEPPLRPSAWGALAALAAALAAALGWAIVSLPSEAPGLSAHIEAQIPHAGASNPVTAVLLNFRSYDTMLELAVLLLAALGASVLAGGPSAVQRPTAASDSPVLLGFVRFVAPVMIVIAGYVLWIGAEAPGGAFQSGAVLAALAVLLLLSGVDWTRRLGDRAELALLAAGLAVFLAAGVGVMGRGGQFLEYPPTAAKGLILTIEAACTISIAIALAALFVGGRLASPDKDRREGRS